MSRVLISFISKDELKNQQDINQYDQLVDLSDIEEYIKQNPKLWEQFFRNYSAKIVDGKSILEHLQLNEKLNVWFYNKFRLFYDNRNAFYEIQYLSDYINAVDQFHIVSRNLDNRLFPDKNVSVTNIGSQSKSRINYFSIVKYAIVFLFRILISKKSKRVNLKHLILSQVGSEREMTSIKDFKKKVTVNGVWGYLEEQYNHEFGFIEDLAFPSVYKKFSLNFRLFRTKYKETYTNEYILAGSFLKKQTGRKIKQDSTELKRVVKHIKMNLTEPSELLIINHLEKLVPVTKLYIRKFHAYDLFFQNTKPISSILAYAENLSQSKITLDAAKKNNVKTIGLQHGIMRSYNVAYNISSVEASINPMPDLTLVWGEYWKNQLIEYGNYSADTIEIVGQPRADIIPLMKKNYPKNKNLITFFEQFQPDTKERYAAAESFIEVAKTHPELEFIIKMHPSEKEDIYSSLVQKIGAKNVTIEVKKDTFRLLAESGIVMTCFSTVGGEALCFETPLICFDSLGRDIAGYIESEVTYWVKNKQELDKVISQYKKNTLATIETKRYVEETFSVIDGNASKRIKKLILNH